MNSEHRFHAGSWTTRGGEASVRCSVFIGKTEVSAPNLQPLGTDVFHSEEFDLEVIPHGVFKMFKL